MKRSFTSLLAIACLLATSTQSFSQSCLTGGSFTAGATNTFATTAEGYTGDFSWVSSGSGELESTPVSAGATKVLTTSTFFLPNSATTIAWSFDLAGTANVTSYSVVALYSSGGSISSVPVCSGGSLTTTGANLVFASAAPSQIIGANFKLQITFTSTSTGNKVLDVDNFKTNASVAAAALPVTFSYFNGAITTGAVKLTWLVASELNVNRYEVERSSNGKTFSKIGQVAAAGLTTYIYNDATATSGSNYYRIKDVDNDGKYKYSSVVLIKLGKTALAATLKVYPTLTSNSLMVEYASASAGNSIDLLSMDGKLIKTVKPVEGSTEASINVSSLKAGLYLLRYSTNNGESASMKFVKQ